MQQLGDDIRPKDVILSNHPQAGGSHLPDLTVITPVSLYNAHDYESYGHPMIIDLIVKIHFQFFNYN